MFTQYWQPIDDKQTIQCTLCMHYCTLSPNQTGACHVRRNVNGKIVDDTNERPIFVSVESIEKKFLFHTQPGARTLSLSTAGCNFRCRYCINWRVSQRGVLEDDPHLTADEVIAQALAAKVDMVAFTYTEPTIFFEYMKAIAERARSKGLAVALKSNGYMTPEVLTEMAKFVDAINFDLKGWDELAHQQITGARLQPVLENLILARQLGIWVEVSTLIVPGLNDCDSDWEGISGFIASKLGVDTPWHLHRFFPNYQMKQQPATSQDQLRQGAKIGKANGLRYIYSKDLSRSHTQTCCPNCEALLIDRDRFDLRSNHLLNGTCPTCHTPIAGFRMAGPLTTVSA